MAARSTFTRTSGSVITSAWANSLRDHVVPYSGITDGTTEGMLSVNTADDTLRIGNGSAGVAVANYGAPPSWSLASSGTQVVQGGGGANGSVLNSKWIRSGRSIKAIGQVTFAVASGTAGQPIIVRTAGGGLPAPGSDDVCGTFQYFRPGVPILYNGTVSMAPNGDIYMYDSASPGNPLGTSPSFALALADTIWINLDYFAASAT